MFPQFTLCLVFYIPYLTRYISMNTRILFSPMKMFNTFNLKMNSKWCFSGPCMGQEDGNTFLCRCTGYTMPCEDGDGGRC